MQRSALLSECGQYRYELRRTWDTAKTTVLFIGLNPSVADAEIDDNTIRVLCGYAERWGYGGLVVANLFAYRSTDRGALVKVSDPIGPENNQHLQRLVSEVETVVCVWGGDGRLFGRSSEVLTMVPKPKCLTVLKSGQPGHPLYKDGKLVPIALPA